MKTRLGLNFIQIYLALVIIGSNFAKCEIKDESNADIILNATNNTVKRVDLNEGFTNVMVVNVSSTAAYFIFQIHSFSYPVSIITSNNLNQLNGTNIGVTTILSPKDYEKTFSFIIGSNGSSNNTISALIVIIAYEKDVPIPGGCSKSLYSDIPPYLNVSYDRSLVTVDYDKVPSYSDICPDGQLVMYYIEFGNADFSSATYFEQISKFLTVDDIKANGIKVPNYENSTKSLRYFTAYRGTGTIFAVISTADGKSSSYIPAITYSCNIMNGSDTCYDDVTIWMTLSCTMIFIGLYLFILGRLSALFSGHLITFITLTYLPYSVLYYATDLTDTVIYITVLIIAIAVLIPILLISTRIWDVNIPHKSMDLISSVAAGFLFSSGMLTGPNGDLGAENSTIFWSLFIGIALIITIVVFSFPTKRGFSFIIVGLFFIFMSCDYFIKGAFANIITEMIRNLTVNHYISAVNLNLIYPSLHLLKFAFLIVLALLGVYCFGRSNRGNYGILNINT